jgi:hypothetical protein
LILSKSASEIIEKLRDHFCGWIDVACRKSTTEIIEKLRDHFLCVSVAANIKAPLELASSWFFLEPPEDSTDLFKEFPQNP